METENSKRLNLLCIVEAMAAFLVVFIHAPIPGVIGDCVCGVARISVPLFFIISGFFLFNGRRNIIEYK